MIQFPAHVFLDTSILIGAVFAGTPDAAACLAFCNEIDANDSVPVISELAYVEFADTVAKFGRSPARRAEIDPAICGQFDLEHWTNSDVVRHAWMEFGLDQLDSLLTSSFQSFVEVPLTGALITSARALMTQCNLRSNDAIHVASALQEGTTHLASVDGGMANAVAVIGVILVRDTGVTYLP